jgi:hypothetical protein
MLKEKLKTFFAKKKNKRKTKGQSLVEVALTLPLLLMLLSGLTEFGFMLNYYLSLVDATREVARLFSNYDYDFVDPDSGVTFNESAVGQVMLVLEPKDANDTSRKITMRDDADHPDDIIISIYSVSGGVATLLGTEYHWSDNQISNLDVTEINSRIVGVPPNTGILAVEVFYNYDQVLGLPWMEMLPDPVTLYAYTIMPLSSAEPTATDIP